jgi:hypothetical protein
MFARKKLELPDGKFESLVAVAGEHFNDYLLVARIGKDLHWSSSDQTWAVGAAHRYINSQEELDRVAERRGQNE